ncbi:ATP-dependent zinc protease [Brevirhabdus pacifica]|uniref:ATP-dependent zinc protease family protein n=1 Tax=Brevirhabdus pacifica TaxID=1267768 RepID=UPI001F467F1E|nr:RimK/LysX family protein [Brevirhabdus pacifica]
MIGWREKIALPDLGLPLIHAKIDTGARTSALHATRIRPFERDGESWVRFHIPHAGLTRAADCEARLVDRREIRNTSGIGEERHVIATALLIGGRRWTIEISLADRAGMAMPLILGRTAIRRHRVLVDAGRSFLAGPPAGRGGAEKTKRAAGKPRAAKTQTMERDDE